MRFTPFALAAAAIHGVAAAPSRETRPAERGFACGAPEPDAEHIKISQQFAAQEAALLASGNLTVKATTTVDVYFHVVAKSTSLSGGYVTVRTALLPLAPFTFFNIKRRLTKLAKFLGRPTEQSAQHAQRSVRPSRVPVQPQGHDPYRQRQLGGRLQGL